MISIIYGILDKLPALPSIPNMDSIIITIKDIINTAAYFIPLNHFLIMLGIWIAVINFNFIYKIITKIWESIPTN